MKKQQTKKNLVKLGLNSEITVLNNHLNKNFDTNNQIQSKDKQIDELISELTRLKKSSSHNYDNEIDKYKDGIEYLVDEKKELEDEISDDDHEFSSIKTTTKAYDNYLSLKEPNQKSISDDLSKYDLKLHSIKPQTEEDNFFKLQPKIINRQDSFDVKLHSDDSHFNSNLDSSFDNHLLGLSLNNNMKESSPGDLLSLSLNNNMKESSSTHLLSSSLNNNMKDSSLGNLLMHFILS